MKVKTSELQGAALDWAVAKCEGYPMGIWYDEEEMPMIRDDEVPEWRPSTDWAQGGPIIEREEIGFFQKHDEGYAQAAKPGAEFVRRGPTPLIAAMRCYVFAKLGDEINVPDELALPAVS